MVSIVDLGPATSPVTLRGQTIMVNGVSALSVAMILQQFPELRRVIANKEFKGDIMTYLIETAPRIVGAIIAAGTGHPGDEAVTAAGMALPAGEQYLLLTPIFTLTFPQGVRSFVDGLIAVAQSSDVRGWAPATKSPDKSPSASATDTPQPSLGGTHQDNSEAGPNSSTESASASPSAS